MGLNAAAIQFLLSEKKRGVSFNSTATLGRQDYYVASSQCKILSQLVGFDINRENSTDSFWTHLGAEQYDVIDNSSYEGANILHDLNTPIPDELKSCFDCVVDGGSLEHVFNFPVALKNCMEMVVLGGNLILITPWHHFAGHGFYQFSPELFYRTLCIENGYIIERMFIFEENSWFSVNDPAVIKKRVENSGNDKTLLFISAKKISEASVFSTWPQQSDYDSAWSSGENNRVFKKTGNTLKERLVSQSVLLQMARDLWRKWHVVRNNKKSKKYWRVPVHLEFGQSEK